MQDLDLAIKEYLYHQEFVLNKSISSLRTSQSEIKQFREFVEQEKSLKEIKDISKFTMRSFVNEMTQKRGLNKRTVNKKLSCIRNFFKYLYRQGKVETNPALQVEYQDYEGEQPKIVTYDEIQKLREVIFDFVGSGIRDRFIVEILYSTGITTKELIDLGEGVFDLEKRELTVKGGSKTRIVFFSERTKDYFIKYREFKKQKLKEKYNENILIASPVGARLTDRALRLILKRHSLTAGLERNITSSMFRHTFAVHMLINGMSGEQLIELMGYSSEELINPYLELIKQKEICEQVCKR